MRGGHGWVLQTVKTGQEQTCYLLGFRFYLIFRFLFIKYLPLLIQKALFLSL